MRPFNEDRTWGAKFKKVIHLDDDGNKIYNPEKRTYKYTKVNTVDWDYNLKQAATMLNFLTENKIMDLEGLHKFIISIHGKQSVIRDELKPIERRLKILDKHIEQAEYYREFSKINSLYKQQKPKDKDGFYESYRRE